MPDTASQVLTQPWQRSSHKLKVYPPTGTQPLVLVRAPHPFLVLTRSSTSRVYQLM
jgi:hypothetical protein